MVDLILIRMLKELQQITSSDFVRIWSLIRISTLNTSPGRSIQHVSGETIAPKMGDLARDHSPALRLLQRIQKRCHRLLSRQSGSGRGSLRRSRGDLTDPARRRIWRRVDHSNEYRGLGPSSGTTRRNASNSGFSNSATWISFL